MVKTVIGLSGKAGAGKDTVADYLARYYGFQKDLFAAPLKRAVSDIFCIPENIVSPRNEHDRLLREQPLSDWPNFTARKLLQFVGTDMFRDMIDKDVWAKSLCRRIKDSQFGYFALTDLRFPNEFDMMKKWFGDDFIVISVRRKGFDGNVVGGISKHESEKYELPFDYIINNDSGFDDLYRSVYHTMEKIGIKKASVT
jgi:hypothetical protein